MRLRVALLALLCAVLTVGCYHATVDTGLPPSNQVIVKPFASSWIYGLVPPATIETMSKCPNGVAMVETKLSFVNSLVAFLTLSIYTPMTIRVTCAERSAMGEFQPDLSVPETASESEIHDALARAARLAMLQKRPVYIERTP